MKKTCAVMYLLVEGFNGMKVKTISKNDYICAVCGEEHGLEDVHHVDVKGQTKVICKECATAIKGLV